MRYYALALSNILIKVVWFYTQSSPRGHCPDRLLCSRSLIQAAALLLALAAPEQVDGQHVDGQKRDDLSDSQVFELIVMRCSHEPKERRGTAFGAEGYEGLLTSLHGVVGCKAIQASSRSTGEVYSKLDIISVDIERDVAVLRSDRLAQGIRDGHVYLNQVGSTLPAKGAKLAIFGHPQALKRPFETSLELENPDKNLSDVVTAGDAADAMMKRNSPNLDIRVLSLSGDIQPGYSGAPIFDGSGSVVGIGSGGLRGGEVGIGWGIPLSEVELRSVTDSAVSKRLTELAALDADLLFYFSTEEIPRDWGGWMVSAFGAVPLGDPNASVGPELRAEWRRTIWDRRFDFGLAVGLEPHRIDLQYSTLPGLRLTVDRTVTYAAYVGLSLKYFAFRIPGRFSDPYVAIVAAPVGLLFGLSAGSSASLGRHVFVAIELQGRIQRVGISDVAFNQFGDALIDENREWLRDLRVAVGVGFRR